MPNTQQSDSDENRARDKIKERTSVWLWVASYGVVVVGGLIIGSRYFTTGADRAKFITENLLTASVLAAVVVQVVINRRQWAVMLQGIRPIVKIQASFQPDGYIVFRLANDGKIPSRVRFVFRCTLREDRIIKAGEIDEAEVGRDPLETRIQTKATQAEIDDIVLREAPLRIEMLGSYDWELGTYPISERKRRDPHSRIFSIRC